MPQPQPHDYAIVVGINRYADADFLRPLEGPRNDVDKFVQWLTSPAGGHLDPDHVLPYRLVSDDQARQPTTGDVVEAVKALLAKAPGGDVRIGRRLYIFLAGHGVGPDLEGAGLFTVEANDDAPVYIEGRRYANLFRGRAVFEEVVLLMDCCRDHDTELPPPQFPFRPKTDAGAAARVKRFYAFATGFGKAAREKAFGAEVSGIFSHVLLAGLNGGAVDGDGRITGPGLARYMRREVGQALPPGVDQPTDIFADPDLVIAEGYPPARAEVTVSSTRPHHRLVVLYGDGFKPLEDPPLRQPDGSYRLQLRIGKTYVFQLHDANGQLLHQDGRAVEDATRPLLVEM